MSVCVCVREGDGWCNYTADGEWAALHCRFMGGTAWEAGGSAGGVVWWSADTLLRAHTRQQNNSVQGESLTATYYVEVNH